MSLAGQFDRNAPWIARDLPPPPSAHPQSRQPAVYPPFEPQAPYYPTLAAAVAPGAGHAPQLAQAALPTSLYSPPPALRGPVRAGGPQSAPHRAVTRPVVAADPAPAPVASPPQQLAQAAPHAGEPTRLYSLHRAYGMTPDAIPEPPKGDRYVFIGPPDGAPQTRDRTDGDDDDTPSAKRERAF